MIETYNSTGEIYISASEVKPPPHTVYDSILERRLDSHRDQVPKTRHDPAR